MREQPSLGIGVDHHHLRLGLHLEGIDTDPLGKRHAVNSKILFTDTRDVGGNINIAKP
ncbi:hypothetical protein D3C80_1727550 [compost metagenome]